MSRELLQRCLNRFIRVGYEGTLVDDLENYLAEPEVKQKPINNDRIIDGYYESKGGAWLMQPFRSFTAGVRFAEKHHGISSIIPSLNDTISADSGVSGHE